MTSPAPETDGGPSTTTAIPRTTPSANVDVPDIAALKVDDDSEWEYEYSTTKTETYYMAIDLSIPEFASRSTENALHAGRGSFHPQWVADPESLRSRDIAHRARPPAVHLDGEDDDDEEPLPEPEDDIDDVAVNLPRNPELNPSKDVQDGEESETKEDSSVRNEIQILDLHSENPIISYRGKVFEGRWAEVLGTELVFSKHEEGSRLPVVRNLPGDVDLLAASTARIQTTERVLRPRGDMVERLAQYKQQNGIRIPVGGKDYTGERRKQARFLENLMAVKRKAGETDDVTVLAKPAENKSFTDSRNPDWVHRRRRHLATNTDAPPQKFRSRRGRLRRPKSPSRKLITSDSSSATARGPQSSAAGSSEVLSIPTPTTWADLDSSMQNQPPGPHIPARERDKDGDVSMG